MMIAGELLLLLLSIFCEIFFLKVFIHRPLKILPSLKVFFLK